MLNANYFEKTAFYYHRNIKVYKPESDLFIVMINLLNGLARLLSSTAVLQAEYFQEIGKAFHPDCWILSASGKVI